MKHVILPHGRPQMPDNVNRVLAEAEETVGEAEKFEEHAVEQPAAIPSGITYKELEWETKAPRESGTMFKECYTYDQHEKRLKEEGWERAPTPQEIFRLLIDDLEGKLNESQQALVSDIQSSYREWFCHAIQRQQNTLHIYEYVTQFPEDTTKQIDVTVIPSWCKNHRSFDITGLEPGSWHELEIVDPKLVTYFYSRPFEALPSAFQTEDQKEQIYIPKSTNLFHLGSVHHSFSIRSYHVSNAASRGVRKIGGSNA